MRGYLLHAFLIATGVNSFSVAPVPRTTRISALFAEETTPEVSDVFSDELAESLAEEVQKTVSIPFVPGPVVTFMLKQAIEHLSYDLNPQMLDRVREFLASTSSTTKYDDFPEADRVLLAIEVAKEINPHVDVPILDEDQEQLVLEEIFKVVFACLATDKSSIRKKFIQNAPTVSRDLLGDEAGQRQLARSVNELVDIPLLDENQEEEILTMAVKSCGGTLQSLLPPEFIETLRGERPEALRETKLLLVNKVNEKVDLVGLDETQERVFIEKMVDLLIDRYIDGTEIEFMLLAKEEQMAKLEEKKLLLERETLLSKQRYKREQENLQIRLDRLKTKMKEAKGRKAKATSTGTIATPAASESPKRRRGPFRWFRGSKD